MPVYSKWAAAGPGISVSRNSNSLGTRALVDSVNNVLAPAVDERRWPQKCLEQALSLEQTPPAAALLPVRQLGHDPP